MPIDATPSHDFETEVKTKQLALINLKFESN